MPPRSQSRYLTSTIRFDGGVKYLTEPSLFAWDESLSGTREHTVSAGERLWDLAYRYFQPIPNAEHLWWVIAAFQPTPITDPTRDLTPGSTLYIPAVSTVQERILAR